MLHLKGITISVARHQMIHETRNLLLATKDLLQGPETLHDLSEHTSSSTTDTQPEVSMPSAPSSSSIGFLHDLVDQEPRPPVPPLLGVLLVDPCVRVCHPQQAHLS
ncbi:Hsp70 protein [Musa troglodytarum]|uniref:Hsp70 protein n=1 Tax=Musa troglodytarum TaxID=320322 RepID=A0A9E7F0F6_9LILI|nr:Hsp70 protein [Musa troglodytarum]